MTVQQHLEIVMQWAVGLLLVVMFGRALAQETPASTEELEAQYAESAYDQAIVKFNTDIKDFPHGRRSDGGISQDCAGHHGEMLRAHCQFDESYQVTSVPFQRRRGGLAEDL
jgi:hypothetical protein